MYIEGVEYTTHTDGWLHSEKGQVRGVDPFFGCEERIPNLVDASRVLQQ